MVLGQVGDERYGNTHIDTCPNGDWQHCQEESPSGGGARQVEVTFWHRLVGLRRWEEEGVRNTQASSVSASAAAETKRLVFTEEFKGHLFRTDALAKKTTKKNVYALKTCALYLV